MSRVVALIDGEHYPAVVREALVALGADHEVVAAAFVGGVEKLGALGADDAYGVPVVRAGDAESALRTAGAEYCPELFIDLSDEPVLSVADRFRLAGVALEYGAGYRGADFEFHPVPVEAVTATPALAVVGTGKRVGKTAVCAHIARRAKAGGLGVAVVAMGRGGPAEPVLVEGERNALGVADLIALARTGAHAASDHYEDAVVAGVTTIGCRRCGGGLAGAPYTSNVADGARLADGLGKDLLLLEGSGSAIPPVAADATVLVVGAAQGPGYVTDYFGPLRLARADLVVLAGAEVAVAEPAAIAATLDAIHLLRPDVRVVPVVFRPRPLGDIAGRSVFFATTAPPGLSDMLRRHLESEQRCRVVAVSTALSDRARLRADLEAAAGSYDLLLTEIKAAAIDVVACTGEAMGVPVVLCDNEPVAVAGADLDAALDAVTALALERGRARGGAR